MLLPRSQSKPFLPSWKCFQNHKFICKTFKDHFTHVEFQMATQKLKMIFFLLNDVRAKENLKKIINKFVLYIFEEVKFLSCCFESSQKRLQMSLSEGFHFNFVLLCTFDFFDAQKVKHFQKQMIWFSNFSDVDHSLSLVYCTFIHPYGLSHLTESSRGGEEYRDPILM